MVTGRQIIILALLVSLFGACGGQQWRHPSKSPNDLAKDMAECERQAEVTALAQSLTGKAPLLVPRHQALQLCLFQKGWTTGEASTKSVPGQPQKLAARPSDRLLTFAGQKIPLPPGARIVAESTKVVGPVAMETINLGVDRDDDHYFVEIIFQKALDLWFNPVFFPLAPPFFTYSSGRLEGGTPWRAFAGQMAQGRWVGGVGVYWLINARDRVIITISRDLPAQTSPACPDCRLDRSQAERIDRTLAEFLSWMSQITRQVPKKGGRTWKEAILEGLRN